MKSYFPSNPVMVNVAGKYFTGSALMKIGEYSHGGRKAIWLESETGERICTLTSNIPEVPLEPGEFIVKTYSENEGIIDRLLLGGIIIETNKIIDSGHVTMPICRFSESFLYKSNQANKKLH